MGNTTILKTSFNDTVVTGCLNGFYSDVYTIMFYDDRHDISPAIELYYQLINGLPLVQTIMNECNNNNTSPLHLPSASFSPNYSDCTCEG